MSGEIRNDDKNEHSIKLRAIYDKIMFYALMSRASMSSLVSFLYPGSLCREHEHGCTLVIDLNEQPVRISGQRLQSPLDLRHHQNLEMSKSLAKVDDALHIGADECLHGFAYHAGPERSHSKPAT